MTFTVISPCGISTSKVSEYFLPHFEIVIIKSSLYHKKKLCVLFIALCRLQYRCSAVLQDSAGFYCRNQQHCACCLFNIRFNISCGIQVDLCSNDCFPERHQQQLLTDGCAVWDKDDTASQWWWWWWWQKCVAILRSSWLFEHTHIVLGVHSSKIAEFWSCVKREVHACMTRSCFTNIFLFLKDVSCLSLNIIRKYVVIVL